MQWEKKGEGRGNSVILSPTTTISHSSFLFLFLLLTNPINIQEKHNRKKKPPTIQPHSPHTKNPNPLKKKNQKITDPPINQLSLSSQPAQPSPAHPTPPMPHPQLPVRFFVKTISKSHYRVLDPPLFFTNKYSPYLTRLTP